MLTLPTLASLFVSGDLALQEAERPWWEDAARLEVVEGIDLVEVPEGEPIGYWPRLVIRRDRVTLDTRAWWLSLPPEIRNLPEARAVLVHEDVLTLVDGRADGGEAALERRLRSLAQAMALVPDREPMLRELVLVPDASTPGETLALVWGAASAWSATAAGAVGGRLRAIHLALPAMEPSARAVMMRELIDDRRCAASVTMDLGTSTLRADPPWVGGDPMLRASGAACPGTPDDGVRAAAELAAACAPAWEAFERELAAEGRQVPEWRCVRVWPVIATSDAGSTLPTLGALLRVSEPVVLGSVAGGLERPAPHLCERALPVQDLPADRLTELCLPPEARERLLGRARRHGWCGTGAAPQLPPLLAPVPADLPPPRPFEGRRAGFAVLVALGVTLVAAIVGAVRAVRGTRWPTRGSD